MRKSGSNVKLQQEIQSFLLNLHAMPRKTSELFFANFDGSFHFPKVTLNIFLDVQIAENV